MTPPLKIAAPKGEGKAAVRMLPTEAIQSWDALSLREFIDRVANAEIAPAGGSAAVVGVALAAALVRKVARSSQNPAIAGTTAAQAGKLRARAVQLIEADAEAFTLARTALWERHQLDPRTRDTEIGTKLARTAKVLLAISEVSADVAQLALDMSKHAHPDLRPDLAVASLLAEAGAATGLHLVEINLGVQPGDERLSRAQALLADARTVREALLPGA
jgi:formiminotetrahydrofolate cyclodeaminase